MIADIIGKLLEKNPDSRYNSAVGLKADLLECEKRLSRACVSSDPAHEVSDLHSYHIDCVADSYFLSSFHRLRSESTTGT